jgi:hypothetical protein
VELADLLVTGTQFADIMEQRSITASWRAARTVRTDTNPRSLGGYTRSAGSVPPNIMHIATSNTTWQRVPTGCNHLFHPASIHTTSESGNTIRRMESIILGQHSTDETMIVVSLSLRIPTYVRRRFRSTAG